jgi:DNA-binding winged helix-turn-helix (wHTH) protein
MQFSPEKSDLLSGVTRFGTFELDSASRELRRHGRKVRLPNQPFQVLRLLVQRAGQVVSREDLRRMLWPSDTFVDFDIGLNSAIRQVRAALGDSARHSVFVETVPHHGYRFLAITSRGGIGERAHVWQEVFDAPGRLAAGSAHVPVAPTHTIALKLTAAEQLWFRSERPPHCDFREAYLRGRYYLNQATLETLLRSYHFLSLAVDKKQDSGENHAALADWYLSAGDQGLLPSHEAIGYAKVEAVQGLELEPGLAEVHACLGRIAFSECNLQRAHAEFETAARLNPSLVDPFLCCALALSYLLRQDEARQYVARARQLYPVSPRTHLVSCTHDL